MRRLEIDMDALIDAMTRPGEVPWRSFLDVQDGAVVEVGGEGGNELDEGSEASEVEIDPERHYEIPRLERREEYDIMAAFPAAVDDDELSERLADALHGRGAFSRFRHVVDSERGLRERWFAFRHDRLVEHARGWLETLNIEPVHEPAVAAPPAPVAPPALAPGPAPLAIGLIDLLLLGAPDGKTERLDGQVLRQIRAPSASEARRLFTHVARELCWHYDRPWRKRYVEGQSAFDIERAHLSLEGEVVELWIDVPVTTWKAFQ